MKVQIPTIETDQVICIASLAILVIGS